jgi:very-short-patch-repair endonuclease
VADRAELLGLGLTEGQIDSLLRAHILIPYVRRVYRLAGAPQSADQAMALACAIAPDVVVSFDSAARLWGMRRVGSDGRLHVTIAGRAHRSIPDAVVHRSHRIDPVDIVDGGDGIRITSPPRTLFDLSAKLSDERIHSIVEQLLHSDACTMATLLETGGRLGERGRPGSARFARVLSERPSGLKAVASDLELRLERALLAAGLPRPERQAEVRLRNGQLVHPDFLWRPEAEALEVDHATFHGGKLDQYYDKWRDRQLRLVGIRVTRVTDQDIAQRLGGVVADVTAILAASRARTVS